MRSLGLALLLAAGMVYGFTAQEHLEPIHGQFGIGVTLPATCEPDTAYIRSSDGTIHVCRTANAWSQIGWEPTIRDFSGMPNNVFVDVLTITVPNTSGSALIAVDLLGSLGAGGSVGAYESTTGRQVLIAVTRVAGLAADAALTVVSSTTDARIPGSTTITQGTQLGSWSGSPTGTQTITLQYRITKGGLGSDNHVAAIRATVLRRLGAAIAIS